MGCDRREKGNLLSMFVLLFTAVASLLVVGVGFVAVRTLTVSKWGRILEYGDVSFVEDHGVVEWMHVIVPDRGLRENEDVAIKVGSPAKLHLVSEMTRADAASFAELKSRGELPTVGTQYIYKSNGCEVLFIDDRIADVYIGPGDVRFARSATGRFLTLPVKMSEVVKEFGKPMRITNRRPKPI